MRGHLLGVTFAGLTIALSGQAHATVATSCSDFATANGTSGFPGTYIGTVGSSANQVCQIGNISSNNVSTTGTYVNNSQSTSIYSFYWAGGPLSIQEKLGNNGIGDAVDVELLALPSSASTAPTTPALASIQIPFSSGPSSAYNLATDQALNAGYYAVDTYLAVGNVTDPTFQVNFTAVPEPASLAVLGASLMALGLLGRKKA